MNLICFLCFEELGVHLFVSLRGQGLLLEELVFANQVTLLGILLFLTFECDS